MCVISLTMKLINNLYFVENDFHSTTLIYNIFGYMSTPLIKFSYKRLKSQRIPSEIKLMTTTTTPTMVNKTNSLKFLINLL